MPDASQLRNQRALEGVPVILFPELDDDDAKKLNEVIARELKVEVMECETPTGGSDFALLADRFPPWVLLQHKDRCDRVLPELALMATDGFDHQLSSFGAYVLFRSLEAWRDVTADHAAGADSEKERHELEEYNELLRYFISEAFEDEDFLTVEVFANAVLRGTDLMDEFGVAIEDHFDLLPDDIRRDIERMASGARRQPGGDPVQEQGSE